ncbi:MAG: glycosyltransferase [Chthoniobacterales bacterium]|nr:glycosyltransferase [Chthoniobacterales bacterium]
MPKTVELFRQALDASVVSFTDGDLLDREGSAVVGAEHVRMDAGLRGRLYSWAPALARARADSLLREADLVSCHSLFRYHVHWVRNWVRRKHIPYWVVPHGCLDPYVFSYRAWQKKPWMRWMGIPFLREASAVIFSTRREMEKAAPFLSRDNGRVIPWPVTNASLPEPERLAARAEWRKELRVGPRQRLLVFLGRLHSMKRPLETIRSFLKAAPARTSLVLAGPDGDLAREELMVLSSGHANIHVIGPVWGARKESLLAAADGFLSLSRRENFGHSAAEAMKVGLPVILSPGNDLAWEIKSLDCGWMLADDDEATAVAAIQAFDHTEDASLTAMGNAGKAWAESHLTFEKFVAALHDLRAESLSRPRP